MTMTSIRDRIEEIGIIPAVRVSSPEDAIFAAQSVMRGGISVVEMTMTTPGAFDVIAEIRQSDPHLIVGAGTVLDLDTARRCIEAGASFLTSPTLDLEVMDFGATNTTLVIPGALTPTEVATAAKAGAAMVKIFPCSQVGGPSYIRALKAPFPHVNLIPAGGVNQLTASDFIRAGSVALGIGTHLVPSDAVLRRKADWIRELCGRFLGIVKEARAISQYALAAK
jgi:2-dehydro-3-deoxyphosphogluconate aldolase / (4S)-4-hydroxy-2-oxoglutarate aldolase